MTRIDSDGMGDFDPPGHITGRRLVTGNTDYSVEEVADFLVVQHDAEELREIASTLGVRRHRGDTKRQTAKRIAEHAGPALDVERRETEFGPDWTVHIDMSWRQFPE